MRHGYLACAMDMLNVSDLDLVAQARSRCDVLTVGVLSDEDVERCTGRAPVVALPERLVLTDHLRGVDVAVVHDELGYSQLGSEVVRMAVAGESASLCGDADAVLSPGVRSASGSLRQALAVQVVA